MKFSTANDNIAPDSALPEFAASLCGRCELGQLQHKRIKTVFWRDGGLVVVRNIPAMVCPTCGEEYVADQVALGLDRMRGNGFAADATSERIIVPVFEYCGVEGAKE